MSIIFLPLIIIFLCGKGAFLIAGFNTKSAAEKDKYNTKALCRFMGFFLLAIYIVYILSFIFAWHSFVFTGLFLFIFAFGLVFANTSNRFKKY